MATGARSSVFVIVSGTATYFTEDAGYEIQAPCLIWSPARRPTRMSVAAGTRGFVLRAPDKIIAQAMPTGSISAQVRNVLAERLILTDLSSDHISKFQNLFEMIEGELFGMTPGALSVIHHCIAMLMVEIWRTASPKHHKITVRPQQISDDFLHLVELHLLSHYSVEEYAQRIGVSRDRLNSAVRRAIGTSPNQHLQTRLIEEAKSLLLHSNLYIAEIADRLGFSDAAYFNRFFQRHTQMPPGKFRKLNAVSIKSNAKDSSFSAWP